jgi:hypothetical protein
MSERQGIEIDYCPTCRGIWLDRGELDKIIERAAADVAPPPQAPQPPSAPRAPVPPQAPPYPQGGHYDPRFDQGRHHDHGYGRHHKRRKSWLEEIFD